MIEIKNKQIVLFQNDRILGAAGDNKSNEVKFLLNRVQNGFDLSDMVAFIKIEPVKADESAYNQLLRKEISDDKLILKWLLTDTNLKDAGKLTVQIEFASPNFYDSDDLSALDDDDLILPQEIEGVNAPVWQSFKADFFVENSIDATAFYSNATKDIITAAVASAIGAAEEASSLFEEIETLSAGVASDKSLTLSYKNSAQAAAQSAQESEEASAFNADTAAFFSEICEERAAEVVENAENAQSYSQSAAQSAESADSSAESASESADAAMGSQTAANISAISAEASKNLALSYKESASDSAESASESATSASESAESASESATSASESATSASESAESAATAAQSASAYCSSAQSAAELVADDKSMTEFYKDEAAASAQRAEALAQTVGNALNGYRHIYTCTVGANDSDISAFEVDEDSFGNAFSLKEFVIFGYIPATAGAANQYIVVSAKPASNSSFYSLGNASVVSASAETFFRYEAQRMGKWVSRVVKNTALSQNADSSTYKSLSYTKDRALDEKAINAIKIACHNNMGVPFAAGTKFEIYGIDA